MSKYTKEEIKTAINNVLSKISVGSNGGSLKGSLIVEGDGTYIKAPAVFVGDRNIEDLVKQESQSLIDPDPEQVWVEAYTATS